MNETPAPVDAATEAKAIASVVAALEGLDDAAVLRVLEWATKRWGGNFVERGRRGKKDEIPDSGDGGPDVAVEFADLASLYDAARPTTETEKTLVAGYWHQVLQKKENLDAFALNSDLKNLGHGVSNITRACSGLMEERPALMLQVKKTGSSQQARKQYRLTEAGIRSVREMVEKEKKGQE